MGFLEVLFTVLGALVIGSIFAFAFNIRGPWGSFWSFLLVLILAGLVAELWIEPIGPVFYNFGWFSTLFVILLFALILAAATPPPPRRGELPETETPTVVFTVFFWFMLVFFLIAIFIALLF